MSLSAGTRIAHFEVTFLINTLTDIETGPITILQNWKGPGR